MNLHLPKFVALAIEKYDKALTAGSVIVLLLVGLFLMLEPTYESNKTAQARASKVTGAELNVRRNELKLLKESVALYDSISLDELHRMLQVAPAQDRRADLYPTIADLVTDAGFRLDQISISDGETVAIPNETIKVKSVNINVTVSGTEGYENYKRLLQTFEDQLRIMDVASISFHPEEVATTLNLTTYFHQP